MKNPKTSQTLYTLWLPIVQFRALKNNIDQTYILDTNKNNSWSWIKFQYDHATITADSLGYFFIDTEISINKNQKKSKIIQFIANILDHETKTLVYETLLNKKVGYVEQTSNFEEFLYTILVEIKPKQQSINLEYLHSTLHFESDELYNNKKIKFSLHEDKPMFHTILNRNFQQLLDKSIYFTHGLEFDKGEIYNLSIITNIENLIENYSYLVSQIHIQIKNLSLNQEELIKQILQKALQDTIEERTILHFLEVTEKVYLSQIIEKISITNEILKQLNSYLLEDIDRDTIKYSKTHKEIEDEWNIEVFIQNLLQTIPKFQMIESRLKEAYYIKIGNTTTNMRVAQSEMITNTLFYHQWKSSIKYFIYTATNAKESLNMYHQNKTLKELEDISYNANYQADIEDIRELQKQKDISLDKQAKMIFLFLAVVTLAGEAPLLKICEFSTAFFSIPQGSLTSLLITPVLNGIDLISNGLIYYIIVSFIFAKWLTNETPHTTKSSKLIPKFLHKKTKKEVPKPTLNIYYYEDSDYDKHEHRSNRNLYNFDTQFNRYQKVFLGYNDTLSAYQLVTKLKSLTLIKNLNSDLFSYSLFPSILKNPPTSIQTVAKYIYRENYRISRNDKVTTKIMFRYKVNDLKLSEFIEFIKQDAFLYYYENFIRLDSTIDESTFVGIKESINILSSGNKEVFEKIELTFYIVYSFVLKLHDINENIYDYSVVKDQFRVHYHINKLDYSSLKNLEDKQEALAQLIYIYFLARLKKFD